MLSYWCSGSAQAELAEQLEAAGQAQDALSHRAAARIAREQGRQAMQEAEIAGAEAATLSHQAEAALRSSQLVRHSLTPHA